METNLSLFTSNLMGSFDLSGHGLLIGRTLARNLALNVGSRVAVYSQRDVETSRKWRGAAPMNCRLPGRRQTLEVRGIFDAGYEDYNKQVILMSIDNAQDLYELGDDVNGLMVMLKDPYQAEAVRRQMKHALGADYAISTWGEENNAMLAVMVEKNVMLYILFFIVIVAAFGITCTLITFVVLKTREIGVLKALEGQQPPDHVDFSQPKPGRQRARGLHRHRRRHARPDLPQPLPRPDAPAHRSGTFSRRHLRIHGIARADRAGGHRHHLRRFAPHLPARRSLPRLERQPAQASSKPCAMANPAPEILLDARDVHKRYELAARSLEVLRGVSLTVARGDFLALRGASGSRRKAPCSTCWAVWTRRMQVKSGPLAPTWPRCHRPPWRNTATTRRRFHFPSLPFAPGTRRPRKRLPAGPHGLHPRRERRGPRP